MSDTRDPKRPRLSATPPFDYEPPGEEELFSELAWGGKPTAVHPLCMSCSSQICFRCTTVLKEMDLKQKRRSELHELSDNFDAELLGDMPFPIHSQRAPVKQFRVRVTSDREGGGVVTSVPSKQSKPHPSLDSTATRSQMGYNHLLNLLKRNLTLSPSDPFPDSQIKSIALEELKKFPISQKISIIGSAFEISTSSLGSMLKKATEDTSARRSLYSRFSTASTQLNTLESYSLFTIQNCCDSHANYLFSEEIARRVVSILNTLTQICMYIPEARRLIFAEYKDVPVNIIPKIREVDHKTHTISGSKPLRELAKSRTRESARNSTILSDTELLSFTKFTSIGVGLVTKCVEVLLHPQINRGVVVACLEFLTTLNHFNPGNHLDCLHRVLIDNQLNAIFELDNLDLRVVHAVVEFYNTLPLIPIFTHYFTSDLFQRFILFVCKDQKPDRLLIRIKSSLLYFLAKTFDLHKKSLVQPSISHLSDLVQTILLAKDLSWVDRDDLLLQVRMLFFFFFKGNPSVFNSSKGKKIAAIRMMKGMKEIIANLKMVFNLLNLDLGDLRSWQFLILHSF